jgi:DNA-binding NarL/FixJ family response regulator
MVRILLADDHDIVRRGLRALLEAQPDWVVCGEARTGGEALAQATDLRPDVAIQDQAMPEINWLEATRRIRQALPTTEVLVFTMHQTDQLVREVLAAGARGYILKSDAATHLIEAVAALAEHRPFFTARVSETLLESFLRGEEGKGEAPAALTAREREVVLLLVDGLGNKEVAEALGISVKTAETHRAAIMRKLGIGSLAELVRYAVRIHLVEP